MCPINTYWSTTVNQWEDLFDSCLLSLMLPFAFVPSCTYVPHGLSGSLIAMTHIAVHIFVDFVRTERKGL